MTMPGGIAAVVRLWETVRHLRAEQWIGRARMRLTRPGIDPRPAPARRPLAGPWAPPAERAPGLVAPTRFRFLNEEADLAEAGWDDPGRAKLWRYHQHYFDDLVAEGAAGRSAWHHALIAAWHEQVPLGWGSGWEPYPLSLRIVNLIKWILAGNEPDPATLDSLAVQARFLRGRLEYHLLGNHLFANAKALFFAGQFFDGKEADGWLDVACAILKRETAEQILPDGGQFELSPMYHALALEDLLDLINVAAAYGAGRHPDLAPLAELWRDRATAMFHWLAAMSHPDGDPAFFNDTALGMTATATALRVYADRLDLAPTVAPDPFTWLRHSGYARLEAGDAVLICDMARIGPDYLPGHAHADTLSFELSIHGRRLFVNSGTSEYGLGAERLRQRGTAAHNSVIVAGRDSSDVWSGFRVGLRARPIGATAGRAGDMLHAECSHDGYRRLAGRPLHHRRWELRPGVLRIADRLEGGQHPAIARYHLHPDITAQPDTARSGRFTLPGRRVVRWTASADAALEPSTWHPGFGISRDTLCIALPLEAGRAALQLEWS